MAKPAQEILRAGDREVPISNPGKVLFPQAGYTKLDLARYYLAVADGALRAAGGPRPVLGPEPHAMRAAGVPMSWSGIPTGSKESSSTRSAHPNRGLRGSRWSRCAFRRDGAPMRSC